MRNRHRCHPRLHHSGTGAEITFRLGQSIGLPVSKVAGDIALTIGNVDAKGYVHVVSAAVKDAVRGLLETALGNCGLNSLVT